MLFSTRNIVDEALRVLARALSPFVARVMREADPGWKPPPHPDAHVFLLTIDRNWPRFQNQLGRKCRSYVNEMVAVRNEWAHGHSFDKRSANRALDTSLWLLECVPEISPQYLQQLEALRIGEGPPPPPPPDGRNARKIIDHLRAHPGECYCDDCLGALTRISPRQTVNQITRRLLSQPGFRKDKGYQCAQCGSTAKLATGYCAEQP